MDYERARQRDLKLLATRQSAESDARLKGWPARSRVLVDNSADRPALEASVAKYRGLVRKAVTCTCGHAATVRVPLGARLRCSKCGKGA